MSWWVLVSFDVSNDDFRAGMRVWTVEGWHITTGRGTLLVRKSQGSVATRWRCGRIVDDDDYKFTAESAEEIWSAFGEVVRAKVSRRLFDLQGHRFCAAVCVCNVYWSSLLSRRESSDVPLVGDLFMTQERMSDIPRPRFDSVDWHEAHRPVKIDSDYHKRFFWKTRNPRLATQCEVTPGQTVV